MTIKIEIYPKCEKPEWVKVGVLCKCWGEGNDIFRIDMVLKDRVVLSHGDFNHGAESFTKLHSPQN